MAILPIVIYPAPILKQRAKPIAAVTEDTRAILRNMLETMYAAPGVGLAAPQINIDQRLIVVDVGHPAPLTMDDADLPEERQPHPYQLINPEIMHRDGQIVWEEGCLSLPELRVDMERAEHVIVKALDIHGQPITIEAHGLLAVVLQHEIDHLNGQLIIDSLSRLKRSMYVDRLKKMVRA